MRFLHRSSFADDHTASGQMPRRRWRLASSWTQVLAYGALLTSVLVLVGWLMSLLLFGKAVQGWWGLLALPGFGIGLLILALGRENRRLRQRLREARQREQRQQVLFDLSIDWVWEMDAEYRFTYIEAGMGAAVRLSPEGILGKTPWELPYLGPCNDWGAFHEVFARRQAVQRLELIRQRDNDPPSYVAISGIPVFDAADQFTGWRGISQDITAQKRAEVALRQHRDQLQRTADAQTERLMAVFDASPMGMAQVINRHFVMVNQAFLELFGWPAEQMLGHSTRMVFESDAAFMDVGQRVTPVQFSGLTHTVNTPFVRADGRVFDGVAYGRAIDIHDPSKGQMWLYQDVSAEREAAAALARSEHAYEEASSIAHIGHFRWNVSEGVIWSAETFRLHGFDPAEPTPDLDQILQRIHPEDAEHWFRLAALAVEEGLTCDYHYRVVHPDGKVLILKECNRLLLDEFGNIVGQFGTVQDQTEIFQAEDALRLARDEAEQANRAKSVFLANMSHELRTPMHAILSFAELAADRLDKAPAEKIQHYLGNIRQAGQRLLGLLNDLLDLSKMEAGKMSYQMTSQPLLPLVHDAIAELQLLAMARAQHIELLAEREDLVLPFDGMRLGQLLRNLLANAIKFSPERGLIQVSIRQGTLPGRGVAAVLLAVQDQGVGIPHGELESVFDKFIQSSATRSNAGGTGLGLPICREIARGHGGMIWASNNDPGPGATLTVALPLMAHPQPEWVRA